MATSAVDVNDPAYQQCAEYKPDKEATWTHPPEKDGWVRAHNSIRAELRDMRHASYPVDDLALLGLSRDDLC